MSKNYLPNSLNKLAAPQVREVPAIVTDIQRPKVQSFSFGPGEGSTITVPKPKVQNFSFGPGEGSEITVKKPKMQNVSFAENEGSTITVPKPNRAPNMNSYVVQKGQGFQQAARGLGMSTDEFRKNFGNKTLTPGMVLNKGNDGSVTGTRFSKLNKNDINYAAASKAFATSATKPDMNTKLSPLSTLKFHPPGAHFPEMGSAGPSTRNQPAAITPNLQSVRSGNVQYDVKTR